MRAVPDTIGSAIGAFVLALLAKPAAVVVPVVAWLLDVWGLAADLPYSEGWRYCRGWYSRGAGALHESGTAPQQRSSRQSPLWARPLIVGDAAHFISINSSSLSGSGRITGVLPRLC